MDVTTVPKQRFGDLFDDVFTQPDAEKELELAAEKCKVSMN